MGVSPSYGRLVFLASILVTTLSPFIIGNLFITEDFANQGGGSVGAGSALFAILGAPVILLFGSIVALAMTFLRVKQKRWYFLGFFIPAVAVNTLVLL